MTSTGSTNTTEQLSLLTTPSVPLQFRLDERTRRAGLQHVAELRAMMTAQAANRRNNPSGRAAQRRIATPQHSAAA
jgi:hypothetical protein